MASESPASVDALGLFLESLSSARGVSGHESAVADLVEAAWRPRCTGVRRDALGNVIGWRRGEPSRKGMGARARVMLAAHMDEIGMLVTRIEKGGFLRVAPVGGVNVQTLLGQEVVVHAADGPLPGVVGVKPPHLLSRDEMKKFPKWDHLFVDLGLSEEEVRRRVQVGDVVTLDARPVRLLGRRMAGKAFDDRVGVCVLFAALEHLATLRHESDVFAVATVQEEVGLRGAVVSAFGLVPDVGVAVDVTFATQRQVSPPDGAPLSRGPVIASGANMHPRVSARLVELAKAHGVPHQTEVIPGRSGTDAWAMQVTRAGVATGLVSVPLRYMHSAVELVDLQDVREAGRLLAHFAASVDGTFVEDLADWGVSVDGIRRDDGRLA